MNIFKMAVGSIQHYSLTNERYMDMTGKEPPYFTHGEDGKMRHYAVCPACDNPIQIIGLMGKAGDGSLHARHIPNTVLGLATYKQVSYDNCPLAAKNTIQVEKSVRKTGVDEISQKILTMLREHFDRIILVLQQSIGIVISQKLAETLLDDYLAEEGHLYNYASLLNIPWMLAYMARSHSIVGRFILDEDMKSAILAGMPNADFSGDKLVKKGKAFLQVNMYFSGHKIQPRDGIVKESMRMVVVRPGLEQPKVIYQKRIVFDYGAFQYYLGIPEGKGTRNQKRLDAARTRLG